MSAWPDFLTVRPVDGWPHPETENRRRSPFSASWSSTLGLLREELRHAAADTPVLQVDVAERDFGARGYPLANARQRSPGVILSFNGREGSLSFPCDTYLRWQDNVRAIALTMESLRRVARYGVAKTGEQYRGWRAIESTPASASMTSAQARVRLAQIADVPADVPGDRIIRLARAAAHPDRQRGDATLWEEVAALAVLLGVTR